MLKRRVKNNLMFPLGALLNGTYVLPSNATKGVEYSCPDCHKSVIFKKGEIKRPHFAHKVDTTQGGCNFYNHPGESDLHLMVKYMIADFLEKKTLKEVYWECSGCNTMSVGSGFSYDIQYETGDKVVIEYKGEGYVADVAVLNNEKVKYIFEICNTHKTTTKRPEPWFEINAKEFLEFIQEDEIMKESVCCMRTHFCNPCNATRNNEVWIFNIDKWKKGDKCLMCDRIITGPLFHRCKRQLCMGCWRYDFDKVKKRFEKPISGFSFVI